MTNEKGGHRCPPLLIRLDAELAGCPPTTHEVGQDLGAECCQSQGIGSTQRKFYRAAATTSAPGTPSTESLESTLSEGLMWDGLRCPRSAPSACLSKM